MSPSADQDLGNGCIDHGVATPISNHRGIVATVDGDGRNVALVWLFDHRGCYALLMIDAATGKSDEIPTPFPPGGDCPYSSILSSRNRFYTHFNSHFAEFDPARRAFTFFQKTAPQMAMGMTEDDAGRIWSVTYPNSGVVCFDPSTGRLRDYGHVYSQNWAQYQRFVAADDTGWVYFAVGNTASQIVSFDPESGTAMPVLPEAERITGTAMVYRDMDGKVYGVPQSGAAEGWYELYRGCATKIGRRDAQKPKPIITSSQGLFHAAFPDGSRLVRCDLVDRVLAVEDARTRQIHELPFDYSSDGAHIMGIAAAPDGTLCGGTAFPMRFFSFNPKGSQWVHREAYGQWNTVARRGDRFFVGGYIHGFLLEWDPSRPWVRTEKGKPDSNPLFLTECEPTINRPHALLPLSDNRTVVLAGTPGYGYTGGGLLFWDRVTKERVLLTHTDLLPQHSVMSLLELPGGRLLLGGTTDAGTGGERKADLAELSILDIASKRIVWHGGVLPGVSGYVALSAGPRPGLVCGLADGVRFFVFDPERREIVHVEETQPRFGIASYQQGPRKFVTAPDGTVYVLLSQAIARVNRETLALELAVTPPVPIQVGGDLLDGRVYFGCRSHLYSIPLPDTATA